MSAWIALWDLKEHPRTLALVRMAVAMVILADFLRIAHLDLVVPLFGPHDVGGISNVMERTIPPLLYRWFPATSGTAVAAHAGVCLAALAFGLGLFTRVAGVVLLLLYAQLALVIPFGDRGIDLLLRNAVLILVFSDSHRWGSLDARRATGSFAGDGQDVSAWPRHLLVLQLLVMYTLSAMQKLGLDWTPLGGFSAIYVILADPAIALFDHSGWSRTLFPVTQIATATTLLFEWSALFVGGVFWYRYTRDRPGRLRAWCVKRNPHHVWLACGVVLHLGIAATMALGIFPWAVMGLYLAFFHPDEIAAASRRISELRAGQLRASAPRPG
jgi:hypothetical protein